MGDEAHSGGLGCPDDKNHTTNHTKSCLTQHVRWVLVIYTSIFNLLGRQHNRQA